MIPFECDSILVLEVMTVMTLGKDGSSIDQKGNEKRCLRYFSILGLGKIYIGMFTF